MKIRAAVVTAAMAISSSALASTEITVQLSPALQSVKRGDTPQFVVTVEAISKPVRIMRFGVRTELRDSYARLLVTRNGSPVEVPRLISDPGPTTEKDYLHLSPGQTLSFTHNGLPFVLSHLPPGTYSAIVTLQPDWSLEPVQSNAVSFQVSGS